MTSLFVANALVLLGGAAVIIVALVALIIAVSWAAEQIHSGNILPVIVWVIILVCLILAGIMSYNGVSL